MRSRKPMPPFRTFPTKLSYHFTISGIGTATSVETLPPVKPEM